MKSEKNKKQQKTGKIILMILMAVGLLAGAESVSAAEYYVDATGGSDGNNGRSHSTAWKTISKINDFAENPGFSDGDVIAFKRGEIWKSDEPIGFDTASINWGTLKGLTIQDYGTGPKPWIDCTTQKAIKINGRINSIDDYTGLQNVIIRNLDVSGMGGGGPNIEFRAIRDIVIDGIYFDGYKNTINFEHLEAVITANIDVYGNITIKNSEIFNLMQPNHKPSGIGESYSIAIAFWHIDKPKTEGRVLIENNTMHHISGDIIHTQNMDSVDGNILRNNTFFEYCENIIDIKSGENWILEYNDIYRGMMQGGAKYRNLEDNPSLNCPEECYPNSIASHGAFVIHDPNSKGTSKNNIIRYNYFHDFGDYSFGGLVQSGGSVYGNYFKNGHKLGLAGSNIIVKDNVFDITHNPTRGPVEIAEGDFTAIKFDYLRDSKIVNNTIYINSDTMLYGIRYYWVLEQNKNIEISNNIIYLDNNLSDVFNLFVNEADDTKTFPGVSNNLFFNPSRNDLIRWGSYWHSGITIYDKTEQTQWRNDGHPGGVFADPLFVDPQNRKFNLQPNSPAIGKGANLDEVWALQSTPAPLKGDLNQDNQVNIQDIQLCVNVILGTETNSGIVSRADVNNDVAVNIRDAQTIANAILNP